jgi:hypothetical protein
MLTTAIRRAWGRAHLSHFYIITIALSGQIPSTAHLEVFPYWVILDQWTRGATAGDNARRGSRALNLGNDAARLRWPWLRRLPVDTEMRRRTWGLAAQDRQRRAAPLRPRFCVSRCSDPGRRKRIAALPHPRDCVSDHAIDVFGRHVWCEGFTPLRRDAIGETAEPFILAIPRRMREAKSRRVNDAVDARKEFTWRRHFRRAFPAAAAPVHIT